MAKLNYPSARILLFKGKLLKGNEHPVLLRMTFARKQKYYSLRLASTPDAWDQSTNKNGSFKRNKEGNIKLKAIEQKVDNILKAFSRDEIEFTFEKFESRFAPKSKPHSVFAFTEAIVEDLKNDNRIGTALSYAGTLGRIKAFRKQKDFKFVDITSEVLTDFVKFLGSTNSANSIGIYLRTLRAIYKRAIKEGLVKVEHYPFIGFEIPSELPRKRALSLNQIEALKNYNTEKGSQLWNSINLFLFSYYCRGINLQDIARLTWKDIENDRIFFKRRKTIRKKNAGYVDVAVSPPMAKIIGEYAGNDHYIFPILSEGLTSITEHHRIKGELKRINKDLQSLPPELGLPGDVTFYWGRHTFATTLKRKGVPTNLIQELLGHESEQTTKAYLDSFERGQLDELSKFL